MFHFYNSHIPQEQFDRNLVDWCKGGPSSDGWTRIGSPLPVPKIILIEHEIKSISVEEVLAKNIDQVKKWHIDFLLTKQSDWEKTNYYKEYIIPRKETFKRMRAFSELFSSVTARGVLKPVFVAEVEGFPFRYFRFDGCHRASCVFVLGHETIPARVFKTKTLHA